MHLDNIKNVLKMQEEKLKRFTSQLCTDKIILTFKIGPFCKHRAKNAPPVKGVALSRYVKSTVQVNRKVFHLQH